MGTVLRKIEWRKIPGKIVELIELQYNEVIVYIDTVGRFILRGYPGKIMDWIEWQWWNFTAIMSYDTDDDQNPDEFCLDKEGIHYVGDTWSSKNRCNKKICVAHDMIKELRCPTLTEHDQCKIYKGSVRDPYPECCDKMECSPFVNPPPMIRPAKPVWWIYENYIHAFSSSSEEELDPHPSTVSAKASGLTPPDE